MTFRSFLYTLCVAALVWTSPLPAAEWYRGNLHMHSFWSDGNVFPEMAVDAYKDLGYHFVVLSDHSHLQLDSQRWIDVEQAKVQTVLKQYYERYGENAAETCEVDGKKQIRLHTVHELKKKLDIPGRFLMIPGLELAPDTNGVTFHGNALNVTETIPVQQGATLAESIDKNALAARKNGEDHGLVSEFMVNHPLWPNYDIDPLSLADAKDTFLFELLCAYGHPRGGPSDRFWNRESLWDIVTAFRIVKGHPLMYSVGSDDTHNYLTFAYNRPGTCWTVVRSEKLEADSIILAMRRGDFYTSCGVEMEDIVFDKTARTLSVKVKPVEGVNYRVQFIGTKRGFDQTAVPFEMEKTDKHPARKGWTFSKEIGIELLSVEGTEASYQLKEDDLYVRAVISSDQRREHQDGFAPETATAWTQPYCP